MSCQPQTSPPFPVVAEQEFVRCLRAPAAVDPSQAAVMKAAPEACGELPGRTDLVLTTRPGRSWKRVVDRIVMGGGRTLPNLG